MNGPAADLGGELVDRRRLDRLRAELVDEQVPVPIDGPGGSAVVEEIGYARRPPVHEGRPPRYGAIVGITPGSRKPETVSSISAEGRTLAELRTAADGRSSFVVRGLGGWLALVGLEHTAEHEADLVRFRPPGTVLVQRTAGGLVRICTEDGIVTWDAMSWRFKPSATTLSDRLAPLLDDVDSLLLADLLDLGVHWLSAGGVGATIVWNQATAPITGVDRVPAVDAPGLALGERSHRSSWLSVLAQMDRAVVVGPDGLLTDTGVTLQPTDRSATIVPPLGGTRHTSARRFSFDHPDAIVLVVSEDGPVSVFRGGAEVAASGPDLCRAGASGDLLRAAVHPDAMRNEACPACGRRLRLAVADFPAWKGGPDLVDCLVCDTPFPVDVYRAVPLVTVPES